MTTPCSPRSPTTTARPVWPLRTQRPPREQPGRHLYGVPPAKSPRSVSRRWRPRAQRASAPQWSPVVAPFAAELVRPAPSSVAPRVDRRHALDERAEGLTVVDVGTRDAADRGRPVRSVVKPTSRAFGRRRAGRSQATQGATGGTFRRCWLRFLQACIQRDSSVHSTRRHSSAFHLNRPCNQEVGVIRKSLTEQAIMPRGGILLSAYLSVRIQCAISHTRQFDTRCLRGGRLRGWCFPTSAGAPTCTGAVVGASKYRHVI